MMILLLNVLSNNQSKHPPTQLDVKDSLAVIRITPFAKQLVTIFTHDKQPIKYHRAQKVSLILRKLF